MHVVLHHEQRVPPLHYGGTERVVHALGLALRKLGHEVTLVAPEGSHIEGAAFVPLRPGTPLRSLVPRGADVLHARNPRIEDPGIPFVVSIDGNGQPGETFPPNTLFVSRKHAENHGSAQFVHNGIDVEGFDATRPRGDYAVFAGFPTWNVKNVRGAIQVARKAGVRLEVIGAVKTGRLRFERHLPHMRGVTWRGGIAEDEKRALLAGARAMVFPVRWDEPFGVAVLEALASGCPVLGTPYGALPEIVTPDVGLLSADGADLARALREAGRFDAKACRARAERFTSIDMARAFVRHYEAVVRTGRVADADPQPPRTRPGWRFDALLPWSPP